MNSEMLPVALLDSEKLAATRLLLRTFRDIEGEEVALEQAKGCAKNRIKELNEEALRLRRMIESGTENREVATYRVVRDLSTEIRRSDNGELVRVEPMSDADRQSSLRFVGMDWAEPPSRYAADPEPEREAEEKANE